MEAGRRGHRIPLGNASTEVCNRMATSTLARVLLKTHVITMDQTVMKRSYTMRL